MKLNYYELKLMYNILKANRWSPISNICVGDYIIAADSSITRVSEVIRKSQKPMYRVVFNNGSSTTVSEDHLWFVNSPSRKLVGKQGRLKTIKQLLTYPLIEKSGNRKHFIPMV